MLFDRPLLFEEKKFQENDRLFGDAPSCAQNQQPKLAIADHDLVDPFLLRSKMGFIGEDKLSSSESYKTRRKIKEINFQV